MQSLSCTYFVIVLLLILSQHFPVQGDGGGDGGGDDGGDCPEFWEPAHSVGLGCLLFYNGIAKHTWDQALQFCRTQENATLVEIMTEDQLAFIEMYMDLFSDLLPYPNTWWTGARDLGGDWEWVTSREPVAGFVWQDGHPGAGGECMVLGIQGATTVKQASPMAAPASQPPQAK